MNRFNLANHKPVVKVTEAAEKPAETVIEMSENNWDLLMSSTIERLVKVAAELDSDNKNQEAEEVHQIIRKYIERL